MFIGRQHETSLLEELFNKKDGKLIVIYGRRRIGKSELMHHYLQNKTHLYIDGLEGEHTPKQIENFINQISHQLKNQFLKNTKFKTWFEVFQYLTEHIFNENKKFVLALDEFQWMAAGQSKLINQIKSFWDTYWKKSGVQLILCGSIAHFMVKKVIHSKALYGRIDLEILLEGLTPNEVTKLIPNKDPQEILRYSLIFNGVPKYYEVLDKNLSFEKNLNKHCFSKNSFFFTEIKKIFYSQFKEHSTYKKIAQLLAQKNYTLEELAKKLKISSGGSLKSYLENLELSGFVKSYRNTITQSKKGQKYKLVDPFLKFYYSQILPHENIISNNIGSDIYFRLVKPQINPWMGLAFENFCILNSRKIAILLGIENLTTYSGPVFSPTEGVQFDLVFIRNDKTITLCEIKYHSSPVSTIVVKEFSEKLKKFKAPKGFSIEKVLIASNGVDKNLSELCFFEQIITGNDFFKN